jgi:two-component system C4-dicarboxylate transport response regulator DctD
MLNKLATEHCKNVVLIDDDAGVLKALTLLLKVMGFEVAAFDLPQKAVEYIQDKTNTIHLVVSDLRMPVLDGIEVLKKVKAENPNLPFLLISGHATSDDVAQALSLGAQGFIGKPFNPAEFERVFTTINFLDSAGK